MFKFSNIMKRNLPPGIGVVLLLFLMPAIWAYEAEQDNYQYYSTTQGLASNNIWDFYEDASGRLLVASSNGINIIGNNEIVHIGRDEGLPADIVLTITPWPGKGLLLGTINGYCLLVNNDIVPFKDSPKEIFRDFEVLQDSSVVAAASRKIYFLTPSGKLRDSLVFADAAQTFRDIYPISNRSFYLASTDGLFFYNYGKIDTIRQFWKKAFWQIERIENQLFFVSNEGVWSTRDGKSFYRLFDPPGNQRRSINDIIKIDDERYWLGTWGEGIFEYEGYQFKRKIGYSDGFPSLYVTRFYKDRSGGIFIGSYGSGVVYRKNIFQQKWLISRYPDIAENMSGAREINNRLIFWGSNKNIGMIDGKRIKFIPLPRNLHKNPNAISYKNNRYYLATANRLYRGKDLYHLTPFKTLPKKATAIRFLQGTTNDLWLLTTSHLIQILPEYYTYKLPQGTYYSTSNKYFIVKTGKTYYTCGEHLPLLKIEDHHLSVISPSYDTMYNGMAVINDTTIIVGENDGITHIKNGRIVSEELLPIEKNQFLISDNSGGYWAGYQNGDIYHINQKDTLLIKGGDLPVYGQNRDAFVANNYLFLISRTGILQYNLFSRNYRFYHINDIVGGNTPGELNKAIPLINSLLLLTNAGIISFNEPFVENHSDPEILLYETDIPTRQQTLKFPTSQDHLIINDNDLIEFKLLGLDLNSGKNLFINTRLLPDQHGFSKHFNRFDFEYTQLPPGSYSFQYYSENFFGNKGKTNAISFEVQSSSVFKPENLFIILLLLIIAGFLVYFFTLKIIQNRKRILADKVSARTEDLKGRLVQFQKERSSRSEFYRIFSHDLKAPVRNILGLTRIISKKITSQPEQVAPYVDRIQNNAMKTMGMIEDILELTRTEYASYPFEEIDLKALFDEIIHPFRGELNEFDIHIDMELNLKKMVGEKKKLKIIFQNLIDNAIKYHAKTRPAKISIKTKKTGDYYQIAIEDNGMGIPSSQQETVFEIYQRGENTVSGEINGRGVGLTSAKRLAEGYMGGIEVASEINKGSTFIVSLSRNYLETKRPRFPNRKK